MSDGIHFIQFPPWDQMNFSSNCNIWGNWLGVILTPNPSNPGDSVGPAFTTSIDLFTAALPATATLPENTTLREYHSQILDWYIFNSYDQAAPISYGPWNLTSEFFKNVLVCPVINCTNEYCQAMAMQGNPDLTGIGVIISYMIEATLATMYLIAFTAWHIRQYLRSKKGKGHLRNTSPMHAGAKGNVNGKRARLGRMSLAQRTLDSFRGSVDNFLSVVMLLSIAMLCASLYLCVNGMSNQAVLSDTSDFPYHSSAVYDMLLSFQASVFSVLPVLLLYSLKSPGMDSKNGPRKDAHRVWMRRIILVTDYNDRQNDSSHDPCNLRGGPGYWRGTEQAQVYVIVTPVVWMVITAFLVTGFGIPGVANNRWIRRLRSVWRLGCAWAICGLMLAMLFRFFVLRTKILLKAGSSDSQNTWSFGQVLALATWIPILVEFCYIFIGGSNDTHPPSGFKSQREDSGMRPSYRYSTVGRDPYQVIQEPTAGDENQASGLSPDEAAKSLAQTAEPYQQGEHIQMMATSVHPTDIEGQPAPHVYHDNAARQPQTPWQQWSSTGW